VARLAPGVSFEVAREETFAVVSAIDAVTDAWDEGVAFRRYADVEVEPVRRMLWIFQGSVLLVLLVACANVAGLTLARTESRRIELAIRSSIGASRGRLVRQMLAESITLALAGGIVGVAGALIGVRTLLAGAPSDLPRREAVHVDPVVLLFATAAALVAGVVFGLLPALRGARVGTQDGLRIASTGVRGGPRTRELLAALQIAVAVVLMSGAGLLLRSFAALTSVEPGFRTDNTLVVELGLDQARYPDRETTMAFHDALLDRLRAIPGVTSAGLSSHLPFSPSDIRASVVREGQIFERGGGNQLRLEMYNGDYIETMGIPVLRGRLPAVRAGAEPREVALNQSAALMLWPGDDAIGKRLSFDVEEGQASPPETLFTVVGIVADVLKRSLDEEPPPIGYYLLPQFRRVYGFASGRSFYLTVGAAGDPAQLLEPVKAAIADLDPALPLRSTSTLEDLVRTTTVPARFRSFALGVFALLAVAVAFVGVYGVMAYTVSRSRREIGVRMALGASGANVRRRVLRRAGAVVAAGCALGITGAAAGGPVLASVLYRIPSRDPLTFAAVIILAAGGSLFAAWLPALRASRVDPMRVLREE
jgi:predicted permease